MTVTIKIDGGVFDRETLDECLKSLGQRDFVDNDGHAVRYASKGYDIIMAGQIAAAPGEQPRGWDLNNSQVTELTFSHGSEKVQISGLAMNLREIYQTRSLDELRDWNDFSKRQDYEIIGAGGDDIIKASVDGHSTLLGKTGDDRLISLGYNDRLMGGAGNDVLVLRSEGAWAQGGAGQDRFVLRDTQSDSRILDFEAGRDRLDLGSVLDILIRRDADVSRLKFIGDDDFGGGRYEMRTDVRHDGGDTYTVLELSLKGHESSLVEFKGSVHLCADDFQF